MTISQKYRAAAVYTVSTLIELTRHLTAADPNDVIVVCAEVLNQWASSLETISPPPLARPLGDWERPKRVRESGELPVGSTKFNQMLASGEIISKLVGGCRFVYMPSVRAVGDPHARLKRGRPPKSTAAELVGSSSRGDPTYLAAQRQLLKQQQDAQPAREASRSTAALPRSSPPR
jgi:hypothetical protein